MRRVRAVLLGITAVGASTAVLEAYPPGGTQRWQRTNYAGRQVSMLGGLAQATATPLALLGAGRTGAAAAVAAGVAGALGTVDDLTEREADRHVKGLRGHLTALRQGQVTTGALKIAGIGSGALLASVLLPVRQPGSLSARRSGSHLARWDGRLAAPRWGSRAARRDGGLAARRPGSPAARRPGRHSPATRRDVTGRLADHALSAALIAGSANLLNLFDLRPGRALKVTCAAAAALTLAGGPGTPVAATALGTAATGLPGDLAERTMLGDTGANALGASLGTALAAHPSRLLRGGGLAAVVGLTLLSERVSFSRVIDQAPVLRAVDRWGRR